MAKTIKNAKFIQEKSRTHAITKIDDLRYKVKSGASGQEYIVTLDTKSDGGSCTCDWAKYRPSIDGRSGCSHVNAVINEWLRENRGRYASVWASQEDADRQHRPSFEIGDGVTLTTRLVGS